MKHDTKRSAALLMALLLMPTVISCGKSDPSGDAQALYPDAEIIKLSQDTATYNGNEVETYDYTWHCDPTQVHDDVKNAPAEYYTGSKPETDAAVYIDSELYYFPELDESGFKRVNYDGESEWAYYYSDGENDDYIFATLPDANGSLPMQMMHSESEASENRVLHITRAGSYILEGTWHGQILIDLGDTDDTFTDESARVTLILNGADINCSVAPGIVFKSVYECDCQWETRDKISLTPDLNAPGASIIIADGTENSVTGCNIYRMLKTQYKDDASGDVKTQKKLRKLDGALYSYMTMSITGGENGTGKLTVNSGFEGIDSELHLLINGGNITVNSQDDGINVNEDNVSVMFLNGGTLTLNPAQGAEGDGIDSNGAVVLNGGTLNVNGVTAPDSALDSEDGVYYNGGSVYIDGTLQNYIAGSSFTESGRSDTPDRPQGGEMPDPGRQTQDFDIAKFKESVAALGDDATLQDVLGLLGMGGSPDGMQKPDGDMDRDNTAPPSKPNGDFDIPGRS